MTREEIEKRISSLEEQLFMINMIDHWTREDTALYDKVYKEINDLKKELDNLEK